MTNALPSVLLPLYPPQSEPLVALINVLVAGYVEAATNRKQMKQALEEHEEQYEEQLRLDLQRGLGPFETLPVEERRASFLKLTDMVDVPLLMAQPDALMLKVKGGQIMLVSPYWQQVFKLRDFLVKHFLRLFREALEHEYAAYQEAMEAR